MPRTIQLARRRVLLAAILVAALLGAHWVWRGSRGGQLPTEVEHSLVLRNLPPNRWVKYHEERPGTWSRQGHAGMAFDSKRGTLLIFGSDTHGENWDNAVHEFDPRLKRWQTHEPASAPSTYRFDAAGTPVAGTQALQPWAMHTYDAIEYHPGLDALVVVSTTDHTPGPQAGPRRRQPTWIYDLSTRRWSLFENGGKAAPTFFGGAAAYDARRGLLVAYGQGVWEMDAAAGTWRKVSSEGHHGMHHTMVYDTRRGSFFVFGAYRPTNQVWVYRPGLAAGDKGSWTQHQPKGDPCPPYSSVPAAHDPVQDVFVLLVDEVVAGAAGQAKARTASTYLYDPQADTYQRLAGADMPATGMNFMMAWDSRHEVAFLVTGDWHGTVTVWAMKPGKR